MPLCSASCTTWPSRTIYVFSIWPSLSSSLPAPPSSPPYPPQGRCAAVLFFLNHLALLPAVEPDALDALMLRSDSSLSGPRGGGGPTQRPAAALGNSYLVDLSKDAGVGQVGATGGGALAHSMHSVRSVTQRAQSGTAWHSTAAWHGINEVCCCVSSASVLFACVRHCQRIGLQPKA